MPRKIHAVYEGGVLRPLEPLEDLHEGQILEVVFEVNSSLPAPDDNQKHTVQLGGVLKDHPVGDITSDLKVMREEAWKHVNNELTRG